MGLSVGFVGKTEALIFRFSVRCLAVRVCGLLCGFRYISPDKKGDFLDLFLGFLFGNYIGNNLKGENRLEKKVERGRGVGV